MGLLKRSLHLNKNVDAEQHGPGVADVTACCDRIWASAPEISKVPNLLLDSVISYNGRFR